jgi:hypothetical protein
MTRPLSDDKPRDLLRGAYAPHSRGHRHARPSLAWSAALFLLGAVTATAASNPWRASEGHRSTVRRDRVEAVQAAGSRYAEALSELASAPPSTRDSAAIAREVAATSLFGVARSFVSAVGDTPEAIHLYRLTSELNRATARAARETGASF